MGCSDQERRTLHLKAAGGAGRTLSPQTPPLPGCRYGSPVPKCTERRELRGNSDRIQTICPDQYTCSVFLCVWVP